mmetsp:Transcript_7903/g.16212  ORF Transcript_7903/g.16212 Transcript_7903/m.16212 type:complete len:450 (-) Transcript_7903:77-1426(-)
MAREAVLALLREAHETSDQKGKVEAYLKAIDAAIAGDPGAAEDAVVEDCTEVIKQVLSPDVSQWVSRDALQHFSAALPKLPGPARQRVAERTLDLVQPRAVNFEEQVALVREQLSALLEAQGEWLRAAQTLAGINLDSNNARVFDDRYKLEKALKISDLYLACDQSPKAESFVNRAAYLLNSHKEDPELQYRYKSCYARILDAKCKFLEAALRYYEISNLRRTPGQAGATGGEGATGSAPASAGQDEAEAMLLNAIICIILARPGPQRSRVLATLHKDERCIKLAGGVYTILQKVYMERILQPSEVQAFATLLKPHHRAPLEDGTTVLEQAVIEHNLQSASRLYKNISFDELGRMLGIDPLRAEKTAASMIGEGRMEGTIDQVDRFIYFSHLKSGGGGGDAKAGEAKAQDRLASADGDVAAWDVQIRNLCQGVNAILDTINARREAAAT